MRSRFINSARAALPRLNSQGAAVLATRFPALRFASSVLRSVPSARCYATSTTPTSTSFDPQERAAQEALDEGSLQLELGNLEEAEEAYTKSLEIKETAIAHYNLGVVQYQRQNLPASIKSFLKSLSLSSASIPPLMVNASTEPLSPAEIILADTHTNLGAAYILSTPPRPDLALEHLQKALMINPDDGECCFNLAAVLEATGDDEEALIAYTRAEKLGIDRAKVNVVNTGAKILRKRVQEEEEKKKAAVSKE